MKFIGTIHNVKYNNNLPLEIKLEYFHRTVTGSFDYTQLFVFPRMYLHNGIHTKEIIISQYPANIWSDIFRLKFRVIDKPGITAEITELLRKQKIIIHTQESEMTRSSQLFSISLIADFTEYCKKNNLKFENLEERRKYLEEKLSDLFKQKFKESINKFSLKKVNFLNFNSEKYTEPGQNILDKKILNKYYTKPHPYSYKVNNRTMLLHREILNDLKINEEVNDEYISFTINSDTEEKYLLLRFFNKEQKVIQFDIKHQNTLGAINDFATTIKNTDERINIINSYNRIEDYFNSAHWTVMVDITETKNDDIWDRLIKNLKKLPNIIDDIKIIEYTNVLRKSTTIKLPERKIKEKKNIELENFKLKENYNKIYKMWNAALYIILILFLFNLFFLYFAYDKDLDANKIIFRIFFYDC